MGAIAIPSLVSSGASLLDSVFGGASQAEKDQARVNRGNELYTCALNGDPTAARVILYGAHNTSSASAVGVQHYQALWSQLQAQYPAIANAALAAGALADSGSGKGCPSGISPSVAGTAVVPTVGASVATAGLMGSIPPMAWLAIGGAAIFALSQQGGGRRQRRGR